MDGVIAIVLVVGAIAVGLILDTVRGGVDTWPAVASEIVAGIPPIGAFTTLSSVPGGILILLVVLRCVHHVDVICGCSSLVAVLVGGVPYMFSTFSSMSVACSEV